MKTIHVSILGCCSTRDTIRLYKQFDDLGKDIDIVVDKYVENASLLSVFENPFGDEDYRLVSAEASKSKAADFQHRKLDQDMKKTHFAFLGEAKSDFLLVDMSSIRLPVFKVHDFVITCEVVWQIMRELSDCEDKDLLLKRILGSDKISPFELSKEELSGLFRRYLDEILKIYDEKNIIFINLKNAGIFVGEGGAIDQELAMKRSNEREDELMEFAYAIAKKHCSKSHFIDALPLTLGDINHRWDLHGLHYVNDVYHYYAESLALIFNGKNKKDAEIEADLLQRKYTNRLFSIICDATNKYALSKTNVLDPSKYPKPGMCALNGVSLKTYADLSFEIEGEAFDKAVFYIYSGSGNPIGDWSFANTLIEPGKYILKTGFDSDNYCRIGLVFANDANDTKWVLGRRFTHIELNHGYKRVLLRVTIAPGAKVSYSGLFTLEKVD